MRSVLRVLSLAIPLACGFASVDASAQSYRDGYDRPGYGQPPPSRGGYGRPQGDRPRYPGRPGGDWRPGAVGIGAGIIGGIIWHPARPPPPAYSPRAPAPPPRRRPRRPVYVEDDDYRERPAVERPRRPPPPRTPPARTAQPAQPPRAIVPAAAENRFVADEVLFELAPRASLQAVLRRHRATAISTQRFELAGATIVRARLEGGRNARTVLRQMAGDTRIVRAQPNYTYTLQQQQAATTLPPPASETAPPVETQASPAPVAPATSAKQPQYAVERIGLPAALERARGKDIRVAVVDSAIDLDHPEFAGIVAERFDAIGGEAPPHSHGTAMAAAIHGQAQLQGIAPQARLLAARAFSAGAPGRAGGTTFHVLAALDWAAAQQARVLNLSFAGPQDRLLSQALAGAAKRRIVAVAAAGNAGPKSAPLYPGADPSVIAVTATDADDKPFDRANQGAYVAVAAPGVDVIAAEPGGRYAFSTGTSIAAAHVSGLVALLLEKRPDLDLDGVRKLLAESARDLGAKGRDPIFGAGRIDAPAALARALPVSALR